MLGGAFERVCALVLHRYCSLTVAGADNVPDGACVIASNHESHMDSVLLMRAAGGGFDEYAMVAALDYFFEARLLPQLAARLLNLIPVRRGAGAHSLRDTILHCRAFTRHGRGRIVVFPEGGRSPDGVMRTFKCGVGLLALELGLPVLPVYIEGTYGALPKGRWLVRPRKLSVRFGEPIRPKAFAPVPPTDPDAKRIAYRTLTAAIEASVRELRDRG
jgi:long-chain acyl-CoA synthetase